MVCFFLAETVLFVRSFHLKVRREDFFKDNLDSTLLLNASYEPIRVISWKKAITLFFLEKVEVVETYERDIRSVNLSIKMPAVVRLLRYAKFSRRKPPLTKMNLMARDINACQYCSIELAYKDATIDHVKPRSHGGETSWSNVVLCCHSCNRKKGGRNPQQANMELNKVPIQPEWLPVLNVQLSPMLPESWIIFLKETKKA